ncbi:MAG: class I SAM-dependent rRNA methyltransferase [Christensenellaceae bacterium]
MANLYLKPNEEKRIIAGHSWVYANEVKSIEKVKNGSLVSVYSSDAKYIGKGYVNFLSKIIVRIFIRDNSEPDFEFFYNRINKANELRKSLGYDDCYRVVFAEADNLPGLIIDKYHDVLSIQVLSLGMELNKSLITDSLVKIFNPRSIVERSDSPVRQKEGLKEFKGVIYGEEVETVEIIENGIKMLVNPLSGQKTGYFLDQKENRLALRKYVRGRTVLDCFCNSGGFSLNAKVGGASRVTALDISEFALKNVEENAKLNNLEINLVQGDVFEKLREYKKEGKKFDVVILDPPAFTKSVNDVKNAYKGYKDINILAMKIINDGGILVSSSCSHFMSFSLFEQMLKESAKEAGKNVRILEIKTQAPDHPSNLAQEETLYLKFFVLSVN